MPVSDLEADILADHALIRDVARDAGALAMKWFHRGAVAWDKSPDNPVTEADIAVNNRIRERLMAARPHYGWLSEETRDDWENRDGCRIFVVDPIDGTKAFIRGEPYFCIAIARLEKDVPVAGVVYNPSTDEMFEATAGGGAYLNGEPIRASQTSGLTGCRMIERQKLFDNPKWRKPWPDMELPGVVPNALAYRICQVAAGEWDAAMALSHKGDWDLAAASLILKEAGGLCTTHKGAAFSFNDRVPIQPSVVAAGVLLHPLIIDRVTYVPVPDPQAVDHGLQPGDPPPRTGAADTRIKLEKRPMNTKAPQAQQQLLHIVIGGELKDVTGVEFEDMSKIEFVGAFGSYKAAYDAWKSAAQRTVDNAEMRFFILHAHRLLDPETGHTHDV